MIYLDNAKAFEAVAKWLKQIIKSREFMNTYQALSKSLIYLECRGGKANLRG